MTNFSEAALSVQELPEPDNQAKKHSAKLVSRIEEECAASNGAISFRYYMELALYESELGYYSAGLQKFGAQGDFITSPEISPLFSQCIGQYPLKWSLLYPQHQAHRIPPYHRFLFWGNLFLHCLILGLHPNKDDTCNSQKGMV